MGRRALSWAGLLAGALVIAVLVRTVGGAVPGRRPWAGPGRTPCRHRARGPARRFRPPRPRAAGPSSSTACCPAGCSGTSTAAVLARWSPVASWCGTDRPVWPGACRRWPARFAGRHTTRPPRGPSSFPHRSCAPGSSACSCSPPGPRAWTPGRPGCCHWPSSSCSPSGCPSTSGVGGPGKVWRPGFSGRRGRGPPREWPSPAPSVSSASWPRSLASSSCSSRGRAPADPARSRRRAARRRPRW